MLGDVLGRQPASRPASAGAPVIAAATWEGAVGTRVAARALPVKLESGVLWVRATTATWAQELSLLAPQIISQLAARGVTVTSLKFVVGKVPGPLRPKSRDNLREAPPDAPIPQDLATEIAKVADPDLGRAIRRAAGKNLGWQEINRRKASQGTPTSGRSAARAPRSAGGESAPRASASPSSRGSPRGSRGSSRE